MATATKRNFRILVPELTLHKAVGELRDPITKEVSGIQQGQGYIAFEDEVVPESDVSPILLEALDNEDHPSHEYAAARIEEVSDEPRQALEARLGVPFADYDEMDADDIVAVMKHLPSGTIQRIKDYEASHEGREEIVGYNIGFGESAAARQAGKVSGDHQETDDAQPAARLTTRQVPEEGAVVAGDGITGTGDPQIPHGSRAEESDAKGSTKKVVRRGRRERTKPEGSGDESDNKND